MPIQRLFKFQRGKKISSSEVNEELDQLVSQSNQIESDYKKADDDFKKTAQLSKITADNGDITISASLTTDDILQKIISKGRGYNTFYAIAGSKNIPPSKLSIRGISHLTTPTFGWVIAFDSDNQVWTNYLNNSSWRGWKKLSTQTSTDDQGKLWTGVMYLNEDQSVKPTKPLSKCKTGWMLAWSRYVPGSGEVNSFWGFTFVPKAFATLSSGGMEHILFQNPKSDSVAGAIPIMKYTYCTDTEIKGHANNGSGDERYAALRNVFEF
ncbi:hypothetical protein J6TS2_50950 [Heyndrickxia sporothermodurans]|nr:hypothetical protein J6TS2_50950 [Heyndrickxia sporothermodurans]